MNEATTGNGDGFGVEAAVSAAVAEPPREKLTKKAITADHPTWCPGCGDFAVLAAFYKVLEKRNLDHVKIVTLAGIGCSSRLPYFVNGHGQHAQPRPAGQTEDESDRARLRSAKLRPHRMLERMRGILPRRVRSGRSEERRQLPTDPGKEMGQHARARAAGRRDRSARSV